MTRYSGSKEAEEFGCYGLVGGFARNLYTHALFSAEACTADDGPFYCTSCFSDAVVRKCTEKKDHFAHKSRLSPVYEGGEGNLHFKCKEEICKALASLVPEGKWETERTIDPNKRLGTPELRPDISGRINGKPVAIEVQASVLSLSKIIKKMEAYTKLNINTIWVVPLTEQLGSLPYRPRLYERYLHSMYYGRIYYWTLGNGVEVDTVHLGIAGRHVEYKEWYEEGEFKTGGDYFKPYKIIKTPVYGNIASIFHEFEPHMRSEFIPENVRKSVPQCLLWKDSFSTWWNTNEEDKYTAEYFEDAYFDIRLPVSNIDASGFSYQPIRNTFHPFRSLVVAQWAVFFDSMGIKYEYKKEKYQLEGSAFVPDFWLPQVSMWAEVGDGVLSEADCQKCQQLCNISGERCLLLEGPPRCRPYWGLAPDKEDEFYSDTDYLLTSEYLHLENRFYCGTGCPREALATGNDFDFGDDYIAAVKESRLLLA